MPYHLPHVAIAQVPLPNYDAFSECACGVEIDNNTNQWVQEGNTGRFIAPNAQGTAFELAGAMQASIQFAAPPGFSQVAIVAGQQVVATYTPTRPLAGAQPGIIAPTLDANNADIQAVGATAQAGNVGLGADAGHVHPWAVGTLTAGGIIYVASSLLLAEDATHLQWDPTGNRLLLVTTTTFDGFRLSGAQADVAMHILNTSSPNGRDWAIDSDSAGNLILFDNTASLSRLLIDKTGRVGIGFTGPAFKLDVNGTIHGITSGAVETIRAEDAGVNGGNISLFGNGATTPNKYLRAQGGSFQIVNSAYTGVILHLTDGGQLVMGGTTAPAGSEPFNAQGSNAGYSLDDRTGGASQRWVAYSSGGILRLWRGADKLLIDNNGKITGPGEYDSGVLQSQTVLAAGSDFAHGLPAQPRLATVLYDDGNSATPTKLAHVGQPYIISVTGGGVVVGKTSGLVVLTDITATTLRLASPGGDQVNSVSLRLIAWL